jgi:hypothetical protein
MGKEENLFIGVVVVKQSCDKMMIQDLPYKPQLLIQFLSYFML